MLCPNERKTVSPAARHPRPAGLDGTISPARRKSALLLSYRETSLVL